MSEAIFTYQGLCKDCKFFSRDGWAIKDSAKERGFGQCTRWRFGYGHEIETCLIDELIIEDDEGWGAIIGPEFGCVLFKEKDSNATRNMII